MNVQPTRTVSPFVFVTTPLTIAHVTMDTTNRSMKQNVSQTLQPVLHARMTSFVRPIRIVYQIKFVTIPSMTVNVTMGFINLRRR